MLRGPTPNSFALYSFQPGLNYSTVAVYTAGPALPSTGIPSGSTGGIGPYPPAQPPLLPYQAVRSVTVQGLPAVALGSVLVASNGQQLFAVSPDTGRVLRANGSAGIPRWEVVATLQATQQRCSSQLLQARQVQTDYQGNAVFVLHPRYNLGPLDLTYVIGLNRNSSVWGNCIQVAYPLTAYSTATVAYSSYTARGLLTSSAGNGDGGRLRGLSLRGRRRLLPRLRPGVVLQPLQHPHAGDPLPVRPAALLYHRLDGHLHCVQQAAPGWTS